MPKIWYKGKAVRVPNEWIVPLTQAGLVYTEDDGKHAWSATKTPGVRTWQCPLCWAREEVSDDDLAEIGTPMCADCDEEMDVVTGDEATGGRDQGNSRPPGERDGQR